MTILPREASLLLRLDVLYRNVHAEDDSDLSALPEADQQVLAYVTAARMSPA